MIPATFPRPVASSRTERKLFHREPGPLRPIGERFIALQRLGLEFVRFGAVDYIYDRSRQVGVQQTIPHGGYFRSPLAQGRGFYPRLAIRVRKSTVIACNSSNDLPSKSDVATINS